MAAKILFSADLAANTDTARGPVPAGKAWSFSVNFCNRAALPTTIRLAICDTAAPGDGEFFIYDLPLAGNSPLERTGLVAQEGKYVVARAGNAGVSVNGYGFEE